MTTAQALIDALIAEYKVERDFIDALPAPSRTSHGTPEAWSALDLQGHITAWKHQTVLRLRNDPAAIIEGSEQETDQANADFFDSFANRSWDAILGDSETTHQELVDELAKLSEADLAQSDRFGWQDSLPLWGELASTLLIHPLMHLAEHAIERGDHEAAQSLADTLLGQLTPLSDSPVWLGSLYYNTACISARNGALDKAFSQLETALGHREDLVPWSKEDPDLVSLRSDERMEKMYAALEG